MPMPRPRFQQGQRSVIWIWIWRSKAIQNADDCGRLLADAESFLSQAKAKAVLAMIDDYGDLTARDREILVKNEVRGVQRLVDGIAVTERTIRSRLFSSMNANRSHP
jgi:hypothetical protein